MGLYGWYVSQFPNQPKLTTLGQEAIEELPTRSFTTTKLGPSKRTEQPNRTSAAMEMRSFHQGADDDLAHARDPALADGIEVPLYKDRFITVTDDHLLIQLYYLFRGTKTLELRQLRSIHSADELGLQWYSHKLVMGTEFWQHMVRMRGRGAAQRESHNRGGGRLAAKGIFGGKHEGAADIEAGVEGGERFDGLRDWREGRWGGIEG
ncbi:hypothetical protein BC936DRAFT_139526 [Jimgerdemannia flammicorona]|uniref:Uncharacterized protein n=1 Tax=Jimgerdemannia flammicorona TaxID=994334 RepID=A0A433B9Q7_9FUNG|nr:hypothetical protein BC936DRAFT_139526 [Jimgerdemannia flammicorona]